MPNQKKTFLGFELCARGSGICQGVQCPYHEKDNNTISCRINLVNDVCALLQMDTTPRVMTLEEIDSIIYKSSKEDERIFWAETRSMTKCSFGIFQLDIEVGGDFEALLMGCSWPVCYRRETYGIKWRCWTSKPTDVQRKVTPWK